MSAGDCKQDLVPAAAAGEGGPGLLDDLPQICGLRADRKGAGLDAGHVQEVVHQLPQTVCLLIDDLEQLAALLGGEGTLAPQRRRRRTLDGRERRLQFVGHHAHELCAEPLQRLLRPLEFRNVLGRPESAHQRPVLVELQLGLFADPPDAVVDDDAVLDVVGLAAQRRRPLLVHVIAVLRMNGPEERLVGQRRALGDAEYPVGLIGPEQFVAPDVQTPAPDVGHRLGPVQVLAAARRTASSARLRSVMSAPWAMVATTVRPSAPVMLAEFHSTCRTSPLWCRIGISTSSQCSPRSVRAICSIEAARSGSGKSASSRWPTTSLAGRPVSRSNASLKRVIVTLRVPHDDRRIGIIDQLLQVVAASAAAPPLPACAR